MAGGRPTMIDVAADAGVSLKTVSRVINNIPTVDPQLVAKVSASIQKLGFRRNPVAASLRAGSSDTVGLVTADLANAFYTTVADAVSSVAMTHGCQVIMASTNEDVEIERRITLDLCQRRVGGLVVVPTGDDQSYLAAEVEMGTPIVFLDRPGSGLDADAVLLDNRGGAAAGMRELLAAGHRRIALLFDDLGIFTMGERLAGVREALGEAGVPEAPELLDATAHSPEPARAALERMLALPDPPTAVFCANNRATIGAVEAILSTTDTVAVVGFDDFEASRLLPLPITVVDYDAKGLGALAAETLFRRIAGDDSAPERRLVATHLVSRGGMTRP